LHPRKRTKDSVVTLKSDQRTRRRSLEIYECLITNGSQLGYISESIVFISKILLISGCSAQCCTLRLSLRSAPWAIHGLVLQFTNANLSMPNHCQHHSRTYYAFYLNDDRIFQVVSLIEHSSLLLLHQVTLHLIYHLDTFLITFI